MDGSATPTIDTSNASRNIAAQSTSKVPHSRGVQRPGTGWVSGEVMPPTVHAHALIANAFNSDATKLIPCYGACMAAENAEQGLVDQWRDILTVHARTLCELDRELHPHGLGASDFEVLDLLVAGTAADGGPSFRVQEISERVHLSQSALSRLIGRLERRAS